MNMEKQRLHSLDFVALSRQRSGSGYEESCKAPSGMKNRSGLDIFVPEDSLSRIWLVGRGGDNPMFPSWLYS